jgi:hypothetical protein
MPMRRRPEDVSESLAVFLPAHLDLSGAHCSFEGGMVTLGLVGIGDRKSPNASPKALLVRR